MAAAVIALVGRRFDFGHVRHRGAKMTKIKCSKAWRCVARLP